MALKLIISEKPLAAEQIAKILSNGKAVRKLIGRVASWSFDKNSERFLVIPMKGHIVNVDFPPEFKNWASTGLEKLAMTQVVYAPTELDYVDAIKTAAKDASEVILATDFDVEGESIALEAVDIIKQVNPEIVVKRSVFSAITQEDLTKAFNDLKSLNVNMAESANARREIDLVWGAVLTRYISMVSNRYGKDFLSIGRVQTPALAICVDREKEILNFKPKPFWVVSLDCDKNNEKFTAVHEEEKFFDKKRAETVAALKHSMAEVLSVEKKKMEIKPPGPFNTTEFLRAASALGFQPVFAMSVAEKLYMQGFISYPRTDNTEYPGSLILRDVLKKLSAVPDFKEHAGKLLEQKKLVATKGAKKATDHPPIYPVEAVSKEKLSKLDWKVYELVARRFMATVAPASEIETVKAVLDYGGEHFVARGKTVLSAGWREFYPYSQVEETFLPLLKARDSVKVDSINIKEDATKPKPRYTPAALLKLLEDLNLGTKSTRAEILQKLIDRGYLQGKANFTPSQIAFAVIDALEHNAKAITRPEMTAGLEQEMEFISEGKKQKQEVVEESRELLLKVLKALEENRSKISERMRGAFASANVLGKCPNCSKDLYMIRMPRGTRFVGCKGYKDGCRTSFPLPAQGTVTPLGTLCPTCSLPMIRVEVFRRRPYEMCINHKCASKEAWKKN